MASQKYCKVQVTLGIGNRKSQVTDPIEVDDAVNTFDGELNTLLLNVEDAIKALPCSDGNYTKVNIVDALCTLYGLQRVPA
jgi:hypothetical protein